jgi:molybdopterin-guanine dinucleotide biosynthesis protein B
LAALGLTVSTIKRTHHDVDLDRPGKDSYRHRQAGAQEVMVASATRFALLRETPAGADLATLVRRMAPVDLIIVEGFKMDALPKIEVYRSALGKPRLWPNTPGIVAVASDAALHSDVPWFDLNDAAGLAAWIATEGEGLRPSTPLRTSP